MPSYPSSLTRFSTLWTPKDTSLKRTLFLSSRAVLVWNSTTDNKWHFLLSHWCLDQRSSSIYYVGRHTYRHWCGPPRLVQCQTASPSFLCRQVEVQPPGHGNWGGNQAGWVCREVGGMGQRGFRFICLFVILSVLYCVLCSFFTFIYCFFLLLSIHRPFILRILCTCQSCVSINKRPVEYMQLL